MKVLVIGGVAAGPKAASKVRRLCPDADITILEKNNIISYSGCGLPYFVSGDIGEEKDLYATPVGTVRDVAFFKKAKDIDVRTETEAVEIDREAKRVKARTAVGECVFEYDKLVLATGSRALVPPIDGINLKNVFNVQRVEDARSINASLAGRDGCDAVIVGGGYIGVEMAEALVARGCRVAMVELLPQILSIIDPEMARLVQKHMEAKGVKVLTSTKVEAILPKDGGAGEVGVVKTSSGELKADIVVMGIGVRPNVELAAHAGLQIGETGAIKVDKFLRTSDPDIFAAGDCAESTDRLTGKPCWVPLGSTANKQGRVVGVNICGGEEEFPGVIKSAVCKVFDFTMARTGLSEREAREEGFQVATCLAPGPAKVHYMPGMKPIFIKLVADRKTRRLLGVQAVGMGECAKRGDVAATAVSAGFTVDDMANLDLCYAPPYANAMDSIITAANVLRNKLDGYMNGVTPDEVCERLYKGEKFVLLDVRSQGEYDAMHIEDSTFIPLGALRSRLEELDPTEEIIAFCKISLRGYEAARVLQGKGFKNVKVMEGGILMWPGKLVKGG